jgi:hypothetical protein
VNRVFQLVGQLDPEEGVYADDVCDVMCGYYGLTPDEFWNGPSNKCFAKPSHKFTFTVNIPAEKVTCSL